MSKIWPAPKDPRHSQAVAGSHSQFQTLPHIPEYSQMLLTNKQPTKQTTKQSNQPEQQTKKQAKQQSAGAFWSISRAFWSVQGGVLDIFGLKQMSDARAMIFLCAAKPNRARKDIFARAMNEFWGRPQRARHSRPKRASETVRPKCAPETVRGSENATTSASLICKTSENDLKRFPIFYV